MDAGRFTLLIESDGGKRLPAHRVRPLLTSPAMTTRGARLQQTSKDAVSVTFGAESVEVVALWTD